MSNEEFLPVPQKQTRLPTNIKEGLKKAGKITKYSLLTMGFGLATVGTMAIAPVLSIPSIIGLTYTGQKLLNNTIYKGYKDLAFVTKKSNNKVKIFQDWTRNDITRPIKNYTDKSPHRAFGVVENPTWEDFQWFLKDRCFPETRAHLKWVLSDVGVPFYDPLMIIEKTKGKMAEDQQWIEVIHRKAS